MSRNQIRIEIDSKAAFAGGKSFGATGPYERLLGSASFAIDPKEKDLPFVCDLEFAPRNAQGLVEFKTILDIVTPVDLSRGNRKLLFDFSNRGGRGAFTRLNDGGGDFSKESAAGLLAGSPHAAVAADNPRWVGQLPPSNFSPQPFLRACFVLTDRWASQGVPPPPSRVPRRSAGQLVSPEEALKKFPKIPSVNVPATPSRLPLWNYGSDFDERGIMRIFPPQAVPGKEYPIQVPQVDADGNDLGGVRYPDI